MMPLVVLSTWWVQGQKVSFSLLPELLYLELKGGGSIVLFNTYNIVLCYQLFWFFNFSWKNWNIMGDMTEGGFAKLCINLWKTWATPLKACNPKWLYFGLLQ